MPQRSVTLLSAGCDWITATQEHGKEAEAIREIALAIADSEMHMGMFGKPWRASGYEGFTCGHLEYGERHDGVIVQMHNHVSHSHWKRVYELARNVSRFDLEITTATDEDARWRVRRHLGQMRRFNKGFKRPVMLEHKVSHNQGMTIYSGSPKSDVYLRIYDKDRESEESQWARGVRFECQFRRRMALAHSFSFYGASNVVSHAARTLRPILQKRGVLYAGLKKFAVGSEIKISSPVRPALNDVGRSLEWLGKSVAPTVDRLLHYTDRDMVLDALGLSVG